MKNFFSLAAAVLFATGILACGGGEANNDGMGADTSAAVSNGANVVPEPSAAAGEVKEYVFHGMIKKIDRESRMITIDHEKIEGYMEAMTMPYKVADPALLDKVSVDQETHFTLRVSGDQALITKIQDEHDAGDDH